MTLDEVEAFLAVVKYGNISQAAEHLFVTQPALTRRVQLLEADLGYPLLVRKKGHRNADLTEQGAAFYQLAWKWNNLWRQMNTLGGRKLHETLAIGCIDNLNHNVMPAVIQELLHKGMHFRLYNAFSEDAYAYLEKGIYDLAFITLQDYAVSPPKGILTRPAFSETFAIATKKELPVEKGRIQKESLPREQEIFLPWNSEFSAWHAAHFDESISPLVYLQHSILATYYLEGAAWTFIPVTACARYKAIGCHIYQLAEMPPGQIVYYVTNGTEKKELINMVLTVLRNHLESLDHSGVQIFLP